MFPSGSLSSRLSSRFLWICWSAWSSCYGLSASLGIRGVPHLLIVVHRGCGWKKLSRVWFATLVSRPFIWLLNVLLRYQVDWFCLADIYSNFIQPIGFFISAEFNILLLLEYLSPNQFSIPALNNREGLLLLVPAIIYLGYSRHLVQYWQTLLQRS